MGLSILLFNWGGGNRNHTTVKKANAIKELEFNWFELLDDKENKTVERIKTESLTCIINGATKNKSINLFGRRLGRITVC
jgi:hypothetical protein